MVYVLTARTHALRSWGEYPFVESYLVWVVSAFADEFGWCPASFRNAYKYHFLCLSEAVQHPIGKLVVPDCMLWSFGGRKTESSCRRSNVRFWFHKVRPIPTPHRVFVC